MVLVWFFAVKKILDGRQTGNGNVEFLATGFEMFNFQSCVDFFFFNAMRLSILISSLLELFIRISKWVWKFFSLRYRYSVIYAKGINRGCKNRVTCNPALLNGLPVNGQKWVADRNYCTDVMKCFSLNNELISVLSYVRPRLSETFGDV